MLNNNNHNSCAFAEQAVSYLYGEINTADKNNFETHLRNCSTCADELAGFTLIRSSVLDWRDEEFSRLETPNFHIQTAKPAKYLSADSVSTEHLSWTANLKRIFSFNQVWATAALGILVVCAGITFSAIYFSGSNEVADKRNDIDLARVAVSPTAEVKKVPNEKNIADQPDKQLTSSDVKDTNPPPEIKREKQIDSDKTNIKISRSSVKTETNNPVRNLNDANDGIKKTSPVQKRRVPTLIDTEDEEDDSIRLADLFAEIDTK